MPDFPSPVINNRRKPTSRKPGGSKYDFPLDELEPGECAEYFDLDHDVRERMIRAARSLVTYYHSKADDNRRFSVLKTDGGFGIWRNS